MIPSIISIRERYENLRSILAHRFSRDLFLPIPILSNKQTNKQTPSPTLLLVLQQHFPFCCLSVSTANSHIPLALSSSFNNFPPIFPSVFLIFFFVSCFPHPFFPYFHAFTTPCYLLHICLLSCHHANATPSLICFHLSSYPPTFASSLSSSSIITTFFFNACPTSSFRQFQRVPIYAIRHPPHTLSFILILVLRHTVPQYINLLLLSSHHTPVSSIQ